MNSFYEEIETIGRFCVPYIIMFMLFILNIIFITSSEVSDLNIPLTVMAIYYWSIYRPMIIPPMLVFAAGVCFDALSGWPIGISSVIFLLLRQGVSSQRVFLTSQPFIVIWLGFTGAIIVTLFLQWLIFGLIYWQWSPITTSALTIIASVLMFPLISLAMHLSHKLLPDQQDQYTAVG